MICLVSINTAQQDKTAECLFVCLFALKKVSSSKADCQSYLEGQY